MNTYSITIPPMPNNIPLELIEKALALTGKTTEDMETIDKQKYIEEEPFFEESLFEFSIEKFYYYLLSSEFIERYKSNVPIAIGKPNWVTYIIWEAIYSYQKGNPEPLISLLSKI